MCSYETAEACKSKRFPLHSVSSGVQMMKKSLKENHVDFEDAIAKCGFGRFNYVLISISGGLMAAAYFEMTSINLILPVAACDLNLTTSDKGILSAIGFVGVILSSFLWGFLSDTKGRRKTLIASLSIACLATILSSLANNFWKLLFDRLLNGFL